ncbi:MAG: polyprenyl synthetase family protein [Candidatus Xenobia bacterium]
MVTLDLAAYVRTQAARVDAALERAFPEDVPTLGHVGEMMRYSLFPGGKRFRPILVLAAAEALGQPPERVMPTACAVEVMHGFSLVHDDLPCMDDDVERRGKPTVHVRYGEAEALLAGDALSIYAFRLAAQNAAVPGVSPAAVVRVVEELADAAGFSGMVGGQMVDIALAGKSGITEADLLTVHRHKTGALIRGSVRAGALLCDASPSQLDALTRYGEGVGLVFQITDDILDAEKAEAASFATVFGVPRSREMAEAATRDALAALDGFGHPADPLRALARFLLERQS